MELHASEKGNFSCGEPYYIVLDFDFIWYHWYGKWTDQKESKQKFKVWSFKWNQLHHPTAKIKELHASETGNFSCGEPYYIVLDFTSFDITDIVNEQTKRN